MARNRGRGGWALAGLVVIGSATALAADEPREPGAEEAELDFTVDGHRGEAAAVTAEDLWRYARLAVSDADGLELTGVEEGALRAAWVSAAEALERFVTEAPAHGSARDARILALRARASAGDLAAAVSLARRWVPALNTDGQRVELAREAVELARAGVRAAAQGRTRERAESALIEALEGMGDVPAKALEPDERALALHEAAERLERRGEAEAGARLYRQVLESAPSLRVAESAAAGLLEPLRERARWDAFIDTAQALRGAALRSTRDGKAFAALMDEQIAGARIQQGRRAEADGRWTDATQAFADAARAGGGGASAADLAYQAAYARVQASAPDADEALMAFAGAHRKDPRAPEAALSAAARADERGEVDVAMARYREVLKRWPRAPRAWEAARRLGELEARDRRALDAARHFETAHRLAPSEEKATLEERCAEAFDLAGRDRDAAAWYARALARVQGERQLSSPERWVEIAVRAGLAAERARQPKRAAEHFGWAADAAAQHGVTGEWADRAHARAAR